MIEDPTPARVILAQLRADPEAYVRKSVANHLNDIAKDHTELMLDWIAPWDATIPETAWIQKHACRNLIKAGHPRALKLFGFGEPVQLAKVRMQIKPARPRIGGALEFRLELSVLGRQNQSVVLDYRMDFRTQRGAVSPKVFKLKTLQMKPGETLKLSHSHSFVDRTTRKHCAGPHCLTILANGKEIAVRKFTLQSP